MKLLGAFIATFWIALAAGAWLRWRGRYRVVFVPTWDEPEDGMLPWTDPQLERLLADIRRGETSVRERALTCGAEFRRERGGKLRRCELVWDHAGRHLDHGQATDPARFDPHRTRDFG
jgi:hypothetical protein